MSFLDYLKENRGQFIDHRIVPPRPRPSSHDAALDEPPGDELDVTGSAWPGRRRRARPAQRDVRFRQLRPLYAPLPYSDPLPYEEPWERAFR